MSGSTRRRCVPKTRLTQCGGLARRNIAKANITNVLVDYGARMKRLLADPDGFYSPKKRPSGHDIGVGFGNGSSGDAIPSNLLQISNTESNSMYITSCKAVGTKCHPARFPVKLPEFFIRFLTDPGDLVVDIFSGSNTTGWSAESEGRHWMAFDNEADYIATSASCIDGLRNTNR